ncbi:MAG: hypothetical protein KatS3mg061_0836 [Dehalococcoidia bacterium]|nr:MAG: hypothetical protein KatS3mg061_0836 [Dehalococcoidia bacterium]
MLFSPVDLGIQRFLVQRDVPDAAGMLTVLACLRRHAGGRRRLRVDPEAVATELGVSELTVRLAIAGLERGGALVRGPDEHGLLTLEQLQPAPDPRRWLAVTIEAERRRRHRLRLLWKLWDYARSTTCRRSWWLRYFGDRTPLAASPHCCDCCDPAGEPVLALLPPSPPPTRQPALPPTPAVPAEEQQVQLILRVVERCQGTFGRQGVATLLRGRLPKRAAPSLATLPEFGALAGLSTSVLHQRIEALVQAGLLTKDATARPRLHLTAAGRQRLVTSTAPLPVPEAPLPAGSGLSATLPALLAALAAPDPRLRARASFGLRRLALRPEVPLALRRQARAALAWLGCTLALADRLQSSCVRRQRNWGKRRRVHSARTTSGREEGCVASIFDRLTTLIRANLNALLDQAEDPEKVLDQIIRDMQNALSEARTQVAEMIARERLLRSDVEENRQLVAEWERKAELALSRGMEDLAREALRRKLDYQKNLELTTAQWQTQHEAVERLKRDLQALQSKYEQAVRQRDALIARYRAARAREQVTRTIRQFSTIDPASELARMEERIRLAEARAAANQEVQQISLQDQFAQLEGDSELEAELEQLRRRVLGTPEAPAQLNAPPSEGQRQG